MKFIKIIYDYIAITWQGGLGTWPGCGSPPRAGAAPPAACGCPPVCLQRRRRLPLLPHVVSGPVPPERAALIRGLPLHGRGDPLFRRHPVQGGTALPDLRYVVQAASSWCAVGALRRCGGGALLLQLRAEGGVIVCSFNLGDLLIY